MPSSHERLRPLLSPIRAGQGSPTSEPASRSPFAADIDRIVFDSGLRLLGGKSQVHLASQSTMTGVRTRLSHSIEVARIARSLAAGWLYDTEEASNDAALIRDTEDILQAASLLHDLGHPPFGHTGETAIGTFFLDHPLGRDALASLPPATQQEFRLYDSNAQTLRYALRLGGWHESNGLRLTAATLCAAVKYPWTGANGATKRSIYTSDISLYGAAAAHCSVERRNATSWRRHPLSYLCEAADDIAWAIIDIQDAATLHLIEPVVAKAMLVPLVSKEAAAGLAAIDAASPLRSCNYLASQAISNLVAQTISVAREYHGLILNGLLDTPLISLIPAFQRLEHARRFATNHIYGQARRSIGPNSIIDVLATYIRTKHPNLFPQDTSLAHALCDYITSFTDEGCITAAQTMKQKPMYTPHCLTTSSPDRI